MHLSRKKVIIGILAAVIILAVVISLPPVWSRVSYYTRQAFSNVKYALFPPSEVVFTPGESDSAFVATSVAATLAAIYPPQTLEPVPTLSTPLPTQPPTSTPTSLPSSAYLEGVIPEPQLWNNCGPATLSMNLSYYNWGETQVEAAEILKPNPRDKNVMPYEMVNFVTGNTYLRALTRMGGDLQTIKNLVSSGFPVLVEKGFEPENLKKEGWMGHFNLVIGYDDARQVFITQDSYLLVRKDNYKTIPGFEVKYADMLANWRAFNYIFLVVYPSEKENDVLNAMGALASESEAYRIAYTRAVEESSTLTNARDRFFAWYNAGTSLVYLQDYVGAAAAYDMAFNIYPEIESITRPWRMLWYQTGPYFAYYYSGRYQDVIDLADQTLEVMSEPVLEESYYWRGMAYLMLGDRQEAVSNFYKSLEYHDGFLPSVQQLQQLGDN